VGITSPFEILQSLDDRCRKNASGLPVNRKISEDWVGIGFSLNGITLLAKMDEVTEILPPPQTIRVPGVKHWVMGLANIRGSLMPVLDMNAYLFGEATRIKKESRVLIINLMGVAAGLLVEEVYGLRRFKPEDHQKETDVKSSAVKEYLNGKFVDQVRKWNVFSVEKLIKTEQFIRVV